MYIYTHIYLNKPWPCLSAGNVSPLLAWSLTKIDWQKLAAPKISCSDFKQCRKQTERYIFQEANKGRGVTQEENGTVQYVLQSPAGKALALWKSSVTKVQGIV